MSVFGREIYKYDLSNGTSRTLRLDEGCAAGEAVFARAGQGEDEGYLLTFVYDAGRDASDLVVIDAQEIEKGPVARVHMPRRVPFGFHGSWIAG
jgi:carotenoid cleavage dioxygenase